MERDTVESREDTGDVVEDADAPLDRDERKDRTENASIDRNEADLRTEDDPASTPLLASEETASFDTRWREVQVAFVDEPRQAVERADQLVEELMERLTSSFSRQRGELEETWDRGDDVSTEDLRQALTRYRSFFQRLLAA
jgi:hypothetical protein